MPKVRLITLEEFKKLRPRQQGYVSYMQGDWSGSELKNHQHNPYPEGSRQHKQFAQGQQEGVLEAQDSEE